MLKALVFTNEVRRNRKGHFGSSLLSQPLPPRLSSPFHHLFRGFWTKLCLRLEYIYLDVEETHLSAGSQRSTHPISLIITR